MSTALDYLSPLVTAFKDRRSKKTLNPSSVGSPSIKASAYGVLLQIERSLNVFIVSLTGV